MGGTWLINAALWSALQFFIVNCSAIFIAFKKEEDKALADYYRNVFENPEAYLTINENLEDDILEDDTYISDEDI